MNHAAGIKGYVYIFLMTNIGLNFILNIGIGLVIAVGIESNQNWEMAIRLAVLIVCAGITAARFSAIEHRIPSPRERELIAMLGFLGTFILVLVSALARFGASRNSLDLHDLVVERLWWMIAILTLSFISIFVFMSLIRGSNRAVN